jgi:ankyrin repeat protein
MLAAFNGHSAIVEALLARGATLQSGGGAWTALHYAANQNHTEVIRRLLGKGADPNVRAVNGVTPLHMAAREGAEKAIEMLLRAGANPGLKTAQGETPERWAVKHGQDTAARLLRAPGR